MNKGTGSQTANNLRYEQRQALIAQRRFDALQRRRINADFRALIRERDFPAESLYETHQVTNVTPAKFPATRTVTRGTGSFGVNSRIRANDPNWKVKVAKKQDATNPYTKNVHSGSPLRISGEVYKDQPYQERSDGFLIYHPGYRAAEWEDSSVDQLALKRLKAKLSDNVGFFNAAIPIAELTELRSGIVSLVDSAQDVAVKLGRAVGRHKKKGKSYRRAVADAWLQWSFGIKPTLSSIQDANKAISKFLTKSDHIVRLTGSALISRNISYVSPGTTGLLATSITGYCQGIDTLIYKYVGSWDLKVASSNDYSASNVFGLNPSSIIPVLYELTPYSWLIDYFTSVGDYLNDTFVVPSGSSIYISKTKVRIAVVDTSAVYVPALGTVVKAEHLKKGHYTFKSVQRSKLTSLPHTSLRFKTAEEIGRNGSNKLANLLSVLKLAHGEQGSAGKRPRIRL